MLLQKLQVDPGSCLIGPVIKYERSMGMVSQKNHMCILRMVNYI